MRSRDDILASFERMQDALLDMQNVVEKRRDALDDLFDALETTISKIDDVMDAFKADKRLTKSDV